MSLIINLVKDITSFNEICLILQLLLLFNGLYRIVSFNGAMIIKSFV